MRAYGLISAALAAAAFLAAGAAVRTSAESSFRAPPVSVLKALKASVGKPFSAGYVFIDGRYVKPPYRVERYGNVLRVNGIVVTGPVVAWSEFAKTQRGAKFVRKEAAPDTGAAPAPAPVPVAPSGADADDDLDSLFDGDDDVPVASSAPVSPAPRVKEVPSGSWRLEGPFEKNEASAALLKRIDDARTRVDLCLRSGGCCFFGRGYADVRGEAAMAKELMEKLPALLQGYDKAEKFARAVRQAGFSYLPPALVGELFANRMQYIELARRRRDEAERREWQKLMTN